MKVQAYEIDQDTSAETVSGDPFEITEAFPGEENSEELVQAIEHVQWIGEYYVGGGASPLVCLRRVSQ